MTDCEKELLRAVLDSPDDELPRLVFADFLEEHGESERAEFIRVQCRIAEINRELVSDEDCGNYECCGERRGLMDREVELWLLVREMNESQGIQLVIDNGRMRDQHRPAHAVVRRGFPHSVRCTMTDFMPGECQECDGKGDYLHPTHYRQQCKLCHGTGKRPGLAAVIGGWPVRDIRFSDVGIINQNTGTFDSPEWVPSGASRIANGVPTGPTPEWLMVCKSLEEISDAAVRYARGEWERHAVSLDAALTAPRNEILA